MGEKQKTKAFRITIANWIAIVGLLFLFLFTALGQAYKSGGEWGISILVAVLITAGAAGLLWFMITAKAAENKLDMWRKVEYGTLGAYIVIILPLSIFVGIMQFFVVYDNREEIKKYAESDMRKIDNLITEYKDFESNAISITGTGLRNATGTNQLCSAELRRFMGDHNIHVRENAVSHENLMKRVLVGEDFNSWFGHYVQETKTEIETAINGWSLIRIPSAGKEIEELATFVQQELTKKSDVGKQKLPRISYDSNSHRYELIDFQSKNFEIEGGVGSLQFRKAIMEASGFNFWAVLMALLIHALILFNYFAAYRTSKIEVGQDAEEDGGIIL